MKRLSRFGSSEQAVFDYVKKHPDCTSRDIADALYSKVSLCGRKDRTSKRDPTLIKREWASKLLQKLKKKGSVYYPHMNIPKWRVKKP